MPSPNLEIGCDGAIPGRSTRGRSAASSYRTMSPVKGKQMNLKELFKPSSKCPSCKAILPTKPARKQDCPHCGQVIRVRQGKLVTEEKAQIIDWMQRLDAFGISDQEFAKHRTRLSEQFGHTASVNDTIWRILNSLVGKYANDTSMLEHVYREMASLVSSEGKDPTEYLTQAEAVRTGHTGDPDTSGQRVFLGHDELAYIRKLRNQGKLDKAEELLRKAEPSPAVLDELRKTFSSRARAAKKQGDWSAVVDHLTSYSQYAAEMRGFCIAMANQEPPDHTDSDKKLLENAKARLI